MRTLQAKSVDRVSGLAAFGESLRRGAAVVGAATLVGIAAACSAVPSVRPPTNHPAATAIRPSASSTPNSSSAIALPLLQQTSSNLAVCSASIASATKPFMAKILHDGGSPSVWKINLNYASTSASVQNLQNGATYNLTPSQMQQLYLPANLGLGLRGSGATFSGWQMGQVIVSMHFYSAPAGKLVVNKCQMPYSGMAAQSPMSPTLTLLGALNVGNTITVNIANLTPNRTWTLYAAGGAPLTQPHLLDSNGAGSISYSITSSSPIAQLSKGNPVSIFAKDSSGETTPTITIQPSSFQTYAQYVKAMNSSLTDAINNFNNSLSSSNLVLSGGIVTGTVSFPGGPSAQIIHDIGTNNTEYVIGGNPLIAYTNNNLNISGTPVTLTHNSTTTSVTGPTGMAKATFTISNAIVVDSKSKVKIFQLSTNGTCSAGSGYISMGIDESTITSAQYQLSCSQAMVAGAGAAIAANWQSAADTVSTFIEFILSEPITAVFTVNIGSKMVSVTQVYSDTITNTG